MIIRDIRIGDKITDGTIVNAYFWSGGKRITVILSTGYAIETDEEELRKWRSVIRRLSEKQSI